MRRTAPLILGAGPAGCAAAITLARGGAAPVLLDRDEAVGDALCGGFLSWRTAAALAELGVGPAALGAHRINRLAVFSGWRRVELALPAPAYGLSRRALDQALRARAIGSGAWLEIDTARSIEGQDVVGRRQRWHGDGLFLATGKHDVRGLSRRRDGGNPTLGLRLRLPTTARRQALLDGRIELHLFAGGYAGIVLQEDGSANVCLAVRKTRFGGDPHALLEGWAQESASFGERLGSDWHQARFDTIGAVPYGYIARQTQPGLFKLGDQAAVVPSLAGEGIAIALASGTMAAQHWLRDGPRAAPTFQDKFARYAHWPVRTASLAWQMAENRFLAPPAVAVAAQVPSVLRWLMQATRLDAPASLAPVRRPS